MTGEQIKGIRKSLGLSQEDFAHKIGCTLQTISQWERGGRISRMGERLIEEFLNSISKTNQ